MEAKARVKAISEIIQKCYHLGIFPFKWDAAESSVQITSSRGKIFQWVLNLVLFGFYVSFQIARYIWTAYDNRNSEKGQSDFQSLISGILVCLFFYIETIRNLRYFPTVANKLIMLSSAFTQEARFTGDVYSAVSKISTRGIRRIKNCSRLVHGMIVVYTLRLIARPDKPFHITSVFLGSDYLKWWKVVCILFQAYITLDRDPGASDDLLYFTKCYPTLRVAQIQWNHYLGRYYTYYIVIVVTTMILNVYEAVTAHTPKALFAVVVIGYCLSLIMLSLAEHLEMSEKVLRSWKYQHEPKWFPMFHKYCRPLYTQNGGFGFIDRRICFTLLEIIVSNSTSLIIRSRNR
ncbi:unnamed protein product [Allacma fusca]|uniref:Uncharacterized protein n=1 Tax=Allacma fusca TaxID=39272 RepID=A0A8J2NWR1_9HEXA|nr:unnamed protein product [Allacma fusca]